MQNGAAALYTSVEENGAISELAFHWSLHTPRITHRIAVHKIELSVKRLMSIDRGDFSSLGIDPATYASLNYARCQAVGDACYRLGYDALRSPSARWPCENVTLFNDHLDLDARFDVSEVRLVDWVDWSRVHKPAYL
jgi:hypothetical protein